MISRSSLLIIANFASNEFLVVAVKYTVSFLSLYSPFDLSIPKQILSKVNLSFCFNFNREVQFATPSACATILFSPSSLSKSIIPLGLMIIKIRQKNIKPKSTFLGLSTNLSLKEM